MNFPFSFLPAYGVAASLEGTHHVPISSHKGNSATALGLARLRLLNSLPHHHSDVRQGGGVVSGGSGRHKCPFCSKAFAQQWHLGRHVRIHTGDRPFRCPVCPMAFNQKSTLAGHLRRHTGDKPFQCNLCHMVFSWKSALVKHLQQQHGLALQNTAGQ